MLRLCEESGLIIGNGMNAMRKYIFARKKNGASANGSVCTDAFLKRILITLSKENLNFMEMI